MICVWGGVGRHDMCMGRGGKTLYVYGGGVGRHDMGEGWEDMI